MSKKERKSANRGGSIKGIGWPIVLGLTAGLCTWLYLFGFLAFAGLHEPAQTWTMQLFWTAITTALGTVIGWRIRRYRHLEPKGVSKVNDITRLTGLAVWASIPEIERKRLSNAESSISKGAE